MVLMGKFTHFILTIVLLILMVMGLLGFPSTVFAAIAAPDSLSIDNYYVYRNLIESGDSLFIFQYNFVYSSYPTTSIDQTFVFRLLSSDGTTEIGAAIPYAYANYGYGKGIVALYFDSSDGVVWGTAYKVRVSGNPAQFEAPPTYNFTLPTTAYTSDTSQEDNRDDLGDTILYTIGRSLEQAWGTGYTLISQQDAGPCLSTQGETYFRNSIYGLQYMAPQIFYLQSADIIQDKPAKPGTSLSDTYKNRLDGTWVETSLQGGADLFEVPLSVLLFVFTIAGCGFLVYFSQKHLHNPYPGYFASVILISGSTLLWLGFTLIGLIVFAGVFISGWLLFFKKA